MTLSSTSLCPALTIIIIADCVAVLICTARLFGGLRFLPRISIVGEGLAFDEAAQTLTYAIKDKPPSQWRLLYLDRAAGVMAARSSVTGLNVIKRVSAAADAIPSTVAGSTVCHAASRSCRHGGQSCAATLRIDDAGNQPSHTLNTRIAISPSQNAGMA